MIDQIFKIGISELYGKLVDGGQQTLHNMEILFNEMKLNNIPFPLQEDFLTYSYKDNNGWGFPFIGKTLSQIIQ